MLQIPIIIPREPIVVKRVPILTNLPKLDNLVRNRVDTSFPIEDIEIDWVTDTDGIVKQYYRMCCSIANKTWYRLTQSGYLDTTVSVEDLTSVGVETVLKCWRKYGHKCPPEFHRIVICAVSHEIKNAAKKNFGRFSYYHSVSFEDGDEIDFIDMIEDTNNSTADIAINAIEEGDMLGELFKRLESYEDATQIAREFIHPSDRTIYEAQMDKARKDMLKSLGHKVNSYTWVNANKPDYIRKSLGMTKSRFKRAYKILCNTCYDLFSSDEYMYSE